MSILNVKSKNSTTIAIENLPNTCPFCHHSITPIPLFAYQDDRPNVMRCEVFMNCPNSNCKYCFIAYYKHAPAYSHYIFTGKVTQGNLAKQNFSQTIANTSPSFVEIYNQSFVAEQHGLRQICGVGYRKALEFLLKDYCIELNPTKEDSIKKILLGQVIDKYVQEQRIQSVAKRAAWLGNDETHYVRKWEEKELGDLKTLISLTIHWIEMEKLTKQFEQDMSA